MPRSLTHLKCLAAFIGGAFVLLCLLFVYVLLGKIGVIWTPWTCLSDVLEQASNQAGHYFEVSQTACSAIAKGPTEISVFAAKHRRAKKTLIFKVERMNDGSRDAEPDVIPIGDRAIRIAVKHIAEVICRNGSWETLTIEYDIGRIVDTDPGKPPGECPRD